MSQVAHPIAEPQRAFRADSLALGMSVMLIMTIVQRGIGFFRGLWLCRVLDDNVLGQWAMAFGFITMVTPMLLLGLPGSLPRYVETYRQQGHLRAFLRRILWLTGGLACAATAGMLLFPQPFGWLIFREATGSSLVWSVALAVLSVIIFNSLNELIASLRQVRVVSLMHFIQSVGFTVIAIACLSAGGNLIALIYSFSAACLLATLPAWWVLASQWHAVPLATEPLNSLSMWQRVMPYAAALWVMNLLANAFELSDRYMILHFSSSAELGQSLVGQYHSARIIPALLVSVAVMASGVLLPYMTADWESGQRRAICERLRKMLFALSASFTLGSAVALWMAPWLFENLLSGRYSSGLAVMPMALTFSIWAAVIAVAQNYLWVAERGTLVGWSLAAGLAVNVGLNHFLLPRFGLSGAVVATLLAHVVVWIGICWSMRRLGFEWDSSWMWVTLLPATLLAGPAAALLCSVAVMVLSPQSRLALRECSSSLRGVRGKLADDTDRA